MAGTDRRHRLSSSLTYRATKCLLQKHLAQMISAQDGFCPREPGQYFAAAETLWIRGRYFRSAPNSYLTPLIFHAKG